MPLKKSVGNMYPWVTHVHTHLAGECQHKCDYCYVQRGRFGPGGKYSGPVRLLEDELNVSYGSGKIIFVEHMNDICGPTVKDEWIVRIVEHTKKFPDNQYVWQTKNPARLFSLALDLFGDGWGRNLFGTTIETTHNTESWSKAPAPVLRAAALREAPPIVRRFVTIEPIMDFDNVDHFVCMIASIRPEFVNIGGATKCTYLPEPSGDDVAALIQGIKRCGITVKEKSNLSRVLSQKEGHT